MGGEKDLFEPNALKILSIRNADFISVESTVLKEKTKGIILTSSVVQ